MGKGFNSARNKQAELAKKMEAAKKQQQQDSDATVTNSGITEENNEAQQEDCDQLQKDRQEFAQLLMQSPMPKAEKRVLPTTRSSDYQTRGSTTTPSAQPSKGPKVRAKTLKKRKVKQQAGTSDSRSQQDDPHDAPLQGGDIARRRDFESLVSTETQRRLGPMSAAQLVPWVPPYLSNYLVVVADPRSQSSDLHQTIQYLTSNLDPSILAQIMVVTADSAAEIVSWKKRAGLEDTPIQIYTDENHLDWMRSYSALVDDERWSMSILVFCTRGIIQTLVRQVDPQKASSLVMDAIQSIEDDEP